MKVVVIPNKQKDKDLIYTGKLTKLLDGYGCSYTVCRDDAVSLSEEADLYIVLGGDGSIMRASHTAARLGIPILSVNLGRMGYMAELEKDELHLIDSYFSGDYHIEERMMLAVTTPDGGEHIALNDAVLSNGRVSKMVSFSLYSNGQYLSSYNADGIIIATPTGSTAYSMSAGGPVVDPSIECLIATPVCPHSLNSRPVIFSGATELALKNENDRDIPMFVTVDGDVEDQELIERYLSEKKGKRVYIAIPQRGQQKSLVDMTRQNAAERVAKTRGAVLGRELSVLEELKELLGLDVLPSYIESYDISNTAGDENVAGMIVYENGRPNKSAYKRFKIKGFSGQDDYGSMAEVLTRRFEEYIKLKDSSEEGFARLPDLILLDGGVGQVSAVRPILEKFGLPIPLFGMVKDDKHRTRAIVNEQGEIAINMNRRLFTFISSMQDEVHRFAIGYHRTRRKKSQLGVSLTEIKGIGTERAKALLKHFRTVSNIKNAELEELKAAPKMNDSAALSVYWHFRRKESEGEE